MQARPDHGSAAIDDTSLNAAINEALAEHDGDALAAIRALLEKVAYLEAARDRIVDLVSRGYARGKLE